MRCNMTFLVIWHLLCWQPYNMMPTVSAMAQLHSLGQDDQKEVQCYFFLVIWPHNVVYVWLHIIAIELQKKSSCNFLFSMLWPNMCQKLYASQMQHILISPCAHMTQIFSIYVTLLRDAEWTSGLTKVTIYPICANSHWKTAVLAALIRGLSGSREVSYLASSQATEVKLTQHI